MEAIAFLGLPLLIVAAAVGAGAFAVARRWGRPEARRLAVASVATLAVYVVSLVAFEAAVAAVRDGGRAVRGAKPAFLALEAAILLFAALAGYAAGRARIAIAAMRSRPRGSSSRSVTSSS